MKINGKKSTRHTLWATAIVLLAFPFFMNSQTFLYNPIELSITSVPGERIGCHAEVKNMMDSKITVHLARLRNDIPLTWTSSFCLNQCYSPFTDEADEDIPASTTFAFIVYFDTDPSAEGNGEVEMRISLKENPLEAYNLVFNATTKITSAADHDAGVGKFELAQNFPNPFSAGSFGNPSTTIRFTVAKTAPVSIRVYDLLGREVRTLVHGVKLQGGYIAQWDGKDNDAHHVPTGLYLYKMQSGDFTQTRRMLLLK